MNLILIINGYLKAVVRNEERPEYLNAVYLGQAKNNLTPFHTLMLSSMERSLDAYLRAVKGQPVFTKPKTGKLLKIGELALKTNVSVPTLRFWTKEGLLSVASYTTGGYQLYDPMMIDRAAQIRQLQSQERLTLAEIKLELTSQEE